METKRERIFLISALTALFVFIIISNFFIPITYAVNDDTTMKAIASGAMSGTPDGHLIFVKYALGMLIAGLYRVVCGVDWYGCVMLGTVLVSVILFIYRAKHLFKNNLIFGVISVIAIFIITIFENYVNFQFTVVSAIAAAAAIFFYNTIDTKKEHCRWEYVIVLLLAWVSYCIRSETFIMALPFAGLSLLFRDGKWRAKITVGLLLLVGLVAITTVEKTAYSSEQWKSYQKYNVVRSSVYDYYGVPKYEDNKEFYTTIGMEEWDVKNLDEYNLYMIDGIADEKMQKVSEYNENLQDEIPFSVHIKESVLLLIEGYFLNRSILVNMLAKMVILANLWFEFKNRRKTGWLNLLFLAVEAALVVYLALDGRILTRVMTALFLIEFYSALSIWCREHQERMGMMLKSKISKLALVGMVVLSGVMIFDVYENQKVQYEDNLEWEKLQAFYQMNSENVYFTNTYYIWQYTDNFNVFEKNTLKNYSKLGEWSTFSPVEDEELKRYGITDVDKALIEKENVYLIYEEPFDAITDHYLEQYNDVEWNQVDELIIAGKTMPVYKLQGVR